ncbi:hypothetical protein ACFLU5_05445 [Bacteroidota bacterium]
MRSFFARIHFLLSAISIMGCNQKVEILDGIMDEGQLCFQINTSQAVFMYQLEAGGYSSILDKEGNDWIGFHPDTAESYPRSASSSYRGLPNLVFRSDDGGAGHPGFNKCISTKISDNSIRSESKSGKWAWAWTFQNDYAILEVEKTDPNHAYWLLYEGIPGGVYQPHKQYWGTDKGGPDRSIPDYHFGNTHFNNWQWAYFGHEDINRIFYIAQLNGDDLIDTFGYLGNTNEGVISPDGMVVFGLGREKGAKPLMTKPQKFVIGFLEINVTCREDHNEVVDRINNILIDSSAY